MRDLDDYIEEEEGFFVQLFEVIRESMPVVSDDFSERVSQRVSFLNDDPRLQSPAMDLVVRDFLTQILETVLSWWHSVSGQGGDDSE